MSVSSGFVISGSDTSKVLFSGDSAYDVDVRGRAVLYVSGGAYVESATIRTSSIIYVDQDATASSLVIRVGSCYVSNGGIIHGAELASKSLLNVSSGGSVTGLTVSSNGNVNVDVYADDGATLVSGVNNNGNFSLSNGVASNFILYSRGVQVVHSGALTSDITVGKSGYLYVSSGGSALGVEQAEGAQIHAVVYGGDTQTLISGSNASGVFYLSGGTAYNFLITNGGMQNIHSGGVAVKTAASGLQARITAYSGSIISAASVGMNASLTLHPATEAKDLVISSGGFMEVYDGVRISGTSVWGSAFFTSANTGDEVVTDHGPTRVAEMYIGDTGEVSFGNSIVFSGAITVDGSLTLRSGTALTLDVSSGVNTAYCVLNDWEKITRTSYTVSVDLGDRVAAGTYRLVGNAGGFDATVAFYAGGEVQTSLTVGGSATVGEIDYTLELNDDDELTLGVGQTIEDAVLVNSTLAVSSAVLANRTTVNTGGVLDVCGGLANSTAVNTWGRVDVASGGVANSTNLNANGYCCVSSGGTAFDTVVGGNAWFHVLSGGSAERTTVQRTGMMYVHEGGEARSATLDGGYLAVSSTGSVESLTVNSDGQVHVSSGATVASVEVNDGGKLWVSSGATAAGVAWTPGCGRVYVVDGAEVVYASAFDGVYYDGWNSAAVSGMTVADGDMYVMAGGSAEGVVVFGADLQIWSGGSAAVTEVGEDGVLQISSGGLAAGTVANSRGEVWVCSSGVAELTTVNSCGYLYVYAGGSANDTTLTSGGSMIVYSGGAADELTVTAGGRADIFRGGNVFSLYLEAGGELGGFSFGEDKQLDEVVDGSAFVEENVYIVDSRMFVVSGGVVSQAFVNGGTLYLAAGATATGGLTFAADAAVFAAPGSVIDFDLSGASTADAAQINELSQIQGAPEYTVTVNRAQKRGTYALAGAAGDFDAALTVNVGDGCGIGTLAPGGELTDNGRTYSLVRSDDQLLLSVECGTQPTRGDFDGDGVSDILFQNLADPMNPLGAWMDADMWRWNGSLGPAARDEWTVYGAYDFTGDGVCDILFRSKLAETEYAVGYYDMGEGGTFKTLGWGVTSEWELAQVGDYDGNGIADILWRNADTGYHGLWLDGADEWAALPYSYLGPTQTVFGAGDVDGDGCDEMLINSGGTLGAWDVSGVIAGTAAAPEWSGFGICLTSDWSVVGSADFDGNGIADILIWNDDTGYVGAYMNCDSGDFRGVFAAASPTEWALPGFGDYDGDGCDDILVRNLETGALGCWSGGEGFAWKGIGWGVDNTWAVIA